MSVEYAELFTSTFKSLPHLKPLSPLAWHIVLPSSKSLSLATSALTPSLPGNGSCLYLSHLLHRLVLYKSLSLQHALDFPVIP